MVDRNPLNRLESSGYDRAAAEQDLKETAIDASKHSSGDVLDMANKNSAYAHGNEHLLSKVDENTTMPSADTTVSGAYSLGQTSTAGVAQNYSTEFPERETHTVGSGSRTINTLPSHVEDLGTTVQTNRTTHVVQQERDPTVTYIPPQSGAYSTNSTGATTYSTGTTGAATTSQTGSSMNQYGSTGASTQQYGSSGTSSSDQYGTSSTTHTTGLPAGQSGVVQHHGVVGENRTIAPTNTEYNVNPSSGVAVGTSTLGIPHGTTTTTQSHGSSSGGQHHAATTPAHSARDETTTTSGQKPKESMMSKIKHAFHK